jgi:hypothetical protein
MLCTLEGLVLRYRGSFISLHVVTKISENTILRQQTLSPID